MGFSWNSGLYTPVPLTFLIMQVYIRFMSPDSDESKAKRKKKMKMPLVRDAFKSRG